MRDPVQSFASAVSGAKAAIGASLCPEAVILRDARWVGVAGETWWWTEQPAEPAISDRDLWRSPANGRLAANTRVTVGGARWAQVTLPLPDGDVARRLLVHEAWHAFGQRGTEHPETPGDGFLESPHGRAVLRCQLAALSAALGGHETAAADAERIRAERLSSVADGERERQEWLEEHEGGAESVAWEVTGGTDQQLAEDLAADLTGRSLTRTFAYLTEPARRRLLARNAGLVVADSPADEVLAHYGYDTILTEEVERAASREEERERRDVAFDSEVLRLRLDPPELVFEPRSVEPHRLGTWYGTLSWRHATGAELTVTDGCVVDPDWTMVLLARPETTSGSASVHGPGWTLTLPDGVRLVDLTM